MSVTVFAPPSAALPQLPGDVEVRRYTAAADLAAALAGVASAVIVSDGLDEPAAVAEAVRANGVVAIEVHSAGWDGETHSPLTAACRGVIGGFGLAAVAYATGVLEPRDCAAG